jgi:hypothetical protein
MFDRFISGRHTLMMLLLASVVCGCAAHTFVQLKEPPEKILMKVTQAITPNDRIVATAHIDVMTVQGHYPVRAALILQKPSYLRLELLPVIGTPDFFLAATPDEMKIFIPSRAELYAGRPSAANLGRFLPWTLSIEDMVMIFSGAYPHLIPDPLSYESYPEGSLTRVSMFTPAGGSQTVWVESNGRMVKLVRREASGREIYEALYEDYEPAGRLAGKIAIKMADSMTAVTVKFTDVEIEKAADLSVFQLPAPTGIKTIQLD